MRRFLKHYFTSLLIGLLSLPFVYLSVVFFSPLLWQPAYFLSLLAVCLLGCSVLIFEQTRLQIKWKKLYKDYQTLWELLQKASQTNAHLLAENKSVRFDIKQINLPVVELNQQGNIVYAHPSVGQLLKGDLSSQIGQSFEQVFMQNPKQNELFLKDWKNLRQGEPQIIDFTYQTLMGDQLYLKALCLPVLFHKGQERVWVFLLDDTEAKLPYLEASRKLTELKKHVACLWINQEGKIVKANDYFFALTGYLAQGSVGMPFAQMTTSSEKATLVVAQLQKAIQSKQQDEIHLELKKKNGLTFKTTILCYPESDSAYAELVFLVQESAQTLPSTDHQALRAEAKRNFELEKALAEKRRELHLQQVKLNVKTQMLDFHTRMMDKMMFRFELDQQLIVRFVNHTACKALAYTSNELLGKRLSFLFDREQKALLDSFIFEEEMRKGNTVVKVVKLRTGLLEHKSIKLFFFPYIDERNQLLKISAAGYPLEVPVKQSFYAELVEARSWV